MRYVTREVLKFAIGLVLIGTWVVATGTLAIATQLMTLDDEWDG